MTAALRTCAPALAVTLLCPALTAQVIDFEPFQSYLTDSSGSWDVVVADFDGDSVLDIATANQWWHDVSVLINDGSGVFGAPIVLPVGDLPHTLVAGDLDGNGFSDMVVSSPATDKFSVIMNQGGGVFSAAQDFTGEAPMGLDLGDLDGDLDLDLAVTFSDTSVVRVLINDGNGNFVFNPTAYPVGQTAWPIPVQVETVDLDGDGDLDLVTSNTNEGTYSVLFNDGNADFSPAANLQGPFTADKMAFGDLDGDGDMDMAWADYWAASSGVVFNQGGGIFGPPVLVGTSDYPTDVLIGDMDNDGDNDVLYAVGQNIEVFPNMGGSTFGARIQFPCANLSSGMAAGDLNGDGLLDVATADEAFPPKVAVLINESPPPLAINYCVSAPNSAGPGPVISLVGLTSIAENNFGLAVSGLPLSEPGIFFYGPTQVQVPFGNGYRCAGGTVTRLFPIANAGSSGHVQRTIDFTTGPAALGPGALTAGSQANFQFWYRDSAAAGSSFNLSGGLSVSFVP